MIPQAGQSIASTGRECRCDVSDETHRVTANVESQRARNVVLRNVIQLLVLESGVNWAKEPSLKAIFLE